MYLCICMSVIRISQLSLKPSTGKCSIGTGRQYLELNSLRKKALFTIYGVICSPRMPLRCVPDSPEDKSAATNLLATWINTASTVGGSRTTYTVN